MGVVNVTPDSFSDGGRFETAEAAVAHAIELAQEGADILDVGGESTRPGAAPVSTEEELRRVLPVVRQLRDMPVSVDTRDPAVMRAALDFGASMINDVEALAGPGAMEAVAGSDCAVCLMHKKGDPATMQQAPRYDDVVAEVRGFLGDRKRACLEAGIAAERIVVDPGFGFGKALEHNLALLKALPAFASLDAPLLAGWSRKSSLGKITGRAADERLAASLAMALLSLQGGARILRVHDVRETRDVVRVWEAMESA
ncbi:MAG TPA: dihydropteroate synthase [Burkholderiales bacterium]|nr:dihydropteroate synthase [Burkholderiales bacterium]